MRSLRHSLISQLLVVTLAMPAYAVRPYARRPDPRKRLTQPLAKPLLPWIDSSGKPLEIQPNPELNQQLSNTLAAAISAGQAKGVATDPNTFKKNAGQAGAIPALGGSGKGGSGAFSYNSGGGNGGDGGGGGDEGGGGGGSGRQPQGRGSKSGGAKAFERWYPMCLFIGEHVSQQQGNAAVKQLIDEAAVCEVNLVVFPITTKNIPNSADAVNTAQTAACNLGDAFGNLGVKHASTSTCAPYDRIAGEMCKDPEDPTKSGPPWNPAVKGCAQLASGAMNSIENALRALYKLPDEESEFQRRLAEIKKDLGAGEGGDGILPSIEETNSCTGEIVGHEALGHSMWGHPNGKSDGNGIGVSKENNATETGDGTGWTGPGCQAMRGKAYTNDGRWKYDANRQNYYTRINDPAAQWDLMGGGQVFKKPPGPPPPGRADRPKTGGPQQISYDEGAGKGGGGGVPTGGGSPKGSSPASVAVLPDSPQKDLPVVPPTKHRRQTPQQIALENLVKGLTPANENDPPPASYPVQPPPPPSPGKPSKPDRLEYDESAPKARADSGNGGAGVAPSFSNPAPSEGGGFTTSLSYDESAPKAAPSGGGGKTSIGYDESAPKGGGGSFSSNVIRMGGDSNLPPPSSGAADLPTLSNSTVKLSPTGASLGSSLSADFFKDAGTGGSSDGSSSSSEEDKNDPRRRRRAPGAGGELRRGPASIGDDTRRVRSGGDSP